MLPSLGLCVIREIREPISINPDKSYFIQIIRENLRICGICVSFYLHESHLRSDGLICKKGLTQIPQIRGFPADVFWSLRSRRGSQIPQIPQIAQICRFP